MINSARKASLARQRSFSSQRRVVVVVGGVVAGVGTGVSDSVVSGPVSGGAGLVGAAFVIAVVAVAAGLVAAEVLSKPERLNVVTRRVTGFSACRLTDVAALLAGSSRPALRDEWRAHLVGDNGHDPGAWPKVRQALGFVASAVQFRLADAADMAWRPVDAVLGSRFLSNLFVWGPVVAVLVAILHHDGRFGLVADIQDPVALCAFLYGVIRTGRWWRGVKPPEPKVRRARE